MKNSRPLILTLFTMLILLFIGSGCASLYRFQVDILEPGTISISPRVDSVVIVNRVQLPRHDKAANYIELSDKDEKMHSRYVVSASAAENLKKFLNNSPKYRHIRIVKDTTYNRQEPVGKKYLQSLREAFQTGGAIILDSLAYNYLPELTRTSFIIEAHTKVVYTAQWKFYTLNNFKQLDKYKIQDVDNWQAEFYDKNSALNALPDRLETARRTGDVIGQKYGARIAPRWLTAERYFYAYHPKLLEGQRAAQNNNWKKAAELWRPLTQNSTKIVTEYACFNMAVAAEMMGKPKIALHWAKKAYDMYKSENTKKYMEILKERIEKQHTLDEQL